MARGGKHGFKLNSWLKFGAVRLTAAHHPKLKIISQLPRKTIAGKDDHDENNNSNGANDDGDEKNNSHGGDDDE